MHLNKELVMEHGYLLHSKGAWKNHAYISKKKVNGKWVYYYRTSGNTQTNREQDARVNKNLSPVSTTTSRDMQRLASQRQGQAKTNQLGPVSSAQQKSAAYNKGMEYLRRYNKTSDRLPEVQLAKRRAAEEEARAKEEAAAKKAASKTPAQAVEEGKGSGKSKKTKEKKEKKEKAAKASSGGSSSGSSKEAATTTPQQNQVSEAELARQREEQRLKEEREKTEKYVKEASVQELALQVMRGQLGNGQERMDKLGDRYSEVQALVNKLMKTKKLGGR